MQCAWTGFSFKRAFDQRKKISRAKSSRAKPVCYWLAERDSSLFFFAERERERRVYYILPRSNANWKYILGSRWLKWNIYESTMRLLTILYSTALFQKDTHTYLCAICFRIQKLAVLFTEHTMPVSRIRRERVILIGIKVSFPQNYIYILVILRSKLSKSCLSLFMKKCR